MVATGSSYGEEFSKWIKDNGYTYTTTKKLQNSHTTKKKFPNYNNNNANYGLSSDSLSYLKDNGLKGLNTVQGVSRHTKNHDRTDYYQILYYNTDPRKNLKSANSGKTINQLFNEWTASYQGVGYNQYKENVAAANQKAIEDDMIRRTSGNALSDMSMYGKSNARLLGSTDDPNSKRKQRLLGQEQRGTENYRRSM